MIKHILWDFDGTLISTYPALVKTFCKLLEDLGIHEDPEIVLQHFKISFPHTKEYYQKKYHLSFDLEKRYVEYKEKYIQIKDCKPFAYISEICEKIALSGRYNYLYTHKDESALTYLEYYNLKKFFRDFVTENNGFPRKPDPSAILFLIEKYKMNPSETLMIGDRSLDIDAGKNAGIKTCYFDETHSNSVANSDYTICNFKELEEILSLP